MNDIDILSIHNEILTSFKNNTDNINTYKSYLKKINDTLNMDNISYRICNKLKESKTTIESKINDIENNTSYNFYIMESTELLEKYKKILAKPVKASFMGKTKINNEEKQQIINSYIEIANKYNYNYKVTQNRKREIVCDNCNNSENFDIFDNNYICIECGNILKHLVTHSSYKDVERVNITAKYTYDRKIHFRDCLNQFQGKQNSTINQQIYDDLIEQFELNRLLIGDANTPKSERFKKITKEHIYMFLKDTGHSKHYEDVILIYYNITGNKPNDISHLEPRLLDDFDILTNLYDKKYKRDKSFDRKNFINTQYVLFQLLKRHKYPCKKNDFNILKTIDRKSFHDEICKDLFEELGWNFTAIF